VDEDPSAGSEGEKEERGREGEVELTDEDESSSSSSPSRGSVRSTINKFQALEGIRERER